MQQKVNRNIYSYSMRSILLLLPSWIVLTIFFLGPTLMAFFFAFTNMSLSGSNANNLQFVGIENFVTMSQDPAFKKSILNTLVFLFFSAVIGQQLIGFFTAYFMNSLSGKSKKILGAIIIAGWVTPEIVCSFIFFAFFSENGTANTIMTLLGLEPIAWLFKYPMFVVILANIWHGTAFSMLAYQTALKDVPQEIEEAASLDGANGWRKLVSIILPVIKGSVLTNMVLITLQTLGVFTLIYALTGGGPGTSSLTLPLYMFEQAFTNYQIGYGTAISLTILVIGSIASILYIKLLKVKI